MNRCLKTFYAIFPIAISCLLTLPLAAFHAESAAQASPRPFPATALRGVLVVQAPPAVVLNGQPDRLSPGARIRDTRNMLVMSGGLVGQTLVVNYLRDASGLIHEVWILSADEAAEVRAGAVGTRNFVFSSDAQTPTPGGGTKTVIQLPVAPNQ